MALVKEGQWKEFSAFAGPRLNRLTAWDKVVLIGGNYDDREGKCLDLRRFYELITHELPVRHMCFE